MEEEERFDLGHTVKKIFVIGIAAGLIFIGFIALMTLIGIVIAIPLLKKAYGMMTSYSGESCGHGKHKMKWSRCKSKFDGDTIE
ncbi:hypothetical protein BMT55_09780 [Listeria newyorkensis]|uniref:Uncharacterized protein n=1 Tax=Listeria newyorkensis TaxID=1497681 RepID=A0ABX4XLQ2_9LIST|nr:MULTISPECIES: hypothetical protein [Listeria]KGL38142.1 hypothetical protein EP56_16745 [Listeriaceae bacterium FSL A5-0209]KGL39306.1 hypothetical protein EP58_14180 [Listeria newyorkensis]PNP91985.1 hypothetical protein BMT55_09780 [Listeria newyorkensis]RQW66108.1 hypothetical protein DUK53_12240 [Listeria sp. SHR_NRA_18]WAO22253.1 hypothetical protein OTR81_02900 [Listeria newyorkensis]